MVDAGLEDRPVLLFSPYVLEGEDRIPDRKFKIISVMEETFFSGLSGGSLKMNQ
jgi:hypothetical protein